jgi:hypothetical protein
MTPTTDTIFSNGTGVVIGHTAQITSPTTPEFQVLGTASSVDAGALFGCWSTTDTTVFGLNFLKSGHGTIGSNTSVENGERVGRINFYVDDGTDYGSNTATIGVDVDGATGSNDTPGRIFFSTTANGAASPTERMRIRNDGSISHTASVAGWAHTIRNADATTPLCLDIAMSGAAPDDTTDIFVRCRDTSATRLNIFADGDVTNHDGTYGTISDIKFKQDIVPARSYWDDFKALTYKKWKDKGDVAAQGDDAPYRLGLVAQDVEAVFPALVPESLDTEEYDREVPAVLDEDGNEVTPATTVKDRRDSATETYKWVKSSIIEGPIMAKVVQELQARVEALEA